MPLDPSIILGVRTPQLAPADPLDTYGKALTLKALMQRGDLDALKYAEAQRGVETNERLRALFAGNPRATATDVMAIDPVRGMAFRKEESETAERTARTAKLDRERVNLETAAHRDQLAHVNDPQTAAQWVAAAYRNPALAPLWQSLGPAEQVVASIPTEPAAFQQWKQRVALGETKFIELNKPHLTNQNLGGTQRIVATPGLGGAPTVVSEAQNTATPGDVMTDARVRAEGAANRATTRRGQDLTDERAREANAVGALSQPFEATVGGRPVLVQQNKRTGQLVDVNTKQPVTGVAPKAGDAEQLASGYARRMSAAEGLMSGNAKGQTPEWDEVATRRLPVVSNMLSSEDRQRYRQAQEDWVRAKLRKESGAVIGEEEMAREIRTYFPQIGDSEGVIRQKADARRTAITAMEQAAGPARSAPTPTQPTTFNSMPDPAQYKGRRIRADDGTIYQSDGNSWKRAGG